MKRKKNAAACLIWTEGVLPAKKKENESKPKKMVPRVAGLSKGHRIGENTKSKVTHVDSNDYNSMYYNACQRSRTPSKAAFQSTSTRFAPLKTFTQVHSYDQLDRTISREVCRISAGSRPHAVFRSSTERFDSPKNATDAFSYEQNHNTLACDDRRRAPTPSIASFRSSTARFSRCTSDTPGPGSYNPTTIDNNTNKGPSLKHQGTRFEKMNAGYTGIHAFDKDYKTISQLKFVSSPSRAVFRSKSKRFDDTAHDSPGPGAYTPSLLSAGLFVH